MDFSTNFKLALKSGFYDFISARDFYREATTAAGIGMNKALVARYIELQALLLTPLAPHWCDYTWQEVLHRVRFGCSSLRRFYCALTLPPVIIHPARHVAEAPTGGCCPHGRP